MPINHTGSGEAERLFKFFNNDGDNYDGGASARRLRAGAKSGALEERFDALRVADEADHDHHADHEQHHLQDVGGAFAETEQDRQCPPARECGSNTSAPIRMAALMTVMTLGQAIWRDPAAVAGLLMVRRSFWRAQSNEIARVGKRKPMIP